MYHNRGARVFVDPRLKRCAYVSIETEREREKKTGVNISRQRPPDIVSWIDSEEDNKRCPALDLSDALGIPLICQPSVSTS